MRLRTLMWAAAVLGVCAGAGCWVLEEPEPGGGSLCAGGPVSLSLPAQVFCDVDRITGTITGPDMATIEISIDKAHPTISLDIPSGEGRELRVRVYTIDNPAQPAFSSEPLLFCVDAGRPVTVAVNVKRGNRNPVIHGVTPSGGQVTAGQSVRLTANVSDPDACDRVESFSWSTGQGTIAGGGASADWTPRCPSSKASCDATVELAVADGRGGTSLESFGYTIGRGNAPPTVSVVAVRTFVLKCPGADLTATATDPDGDPLTLSWSILSGPGRLINITGTADTTATWDSTCTADTADTIVGVTATDPSGASATDTERLAIRR